jgi:shikimate dehydrogenase
MSEPSFRLAGIIGWPVHHSLSPRMHGTWLREHGIAGAYVPMPVQPGRVETALRGLAALGFAGCNVTIPHKEAALAVADQVDPLARRIGAANLFIVQPDGGILARNEDAPAWLASLRDAVPGWRADRGPAVVLGAGGAARAVLAILLAEGAPGIRLLNRSAERAEALAAEMGAGIDVLPWSERSAALTGAALVVNTTSQGMAGQEPLEIALDDLPRDAIVSDLIYVPSETPLLAAARARGNPAVNGLGMLLHQAVPAFEAFFGLRPTITPEFRAAMEDAVR